MIPFAITSNTLEWFLKKILFQWFNFWYGHKRNNKTKWRTICNLNVDCDSHKVLQKYLISSIILEFEKNDMLDDVHQEIMNMNCQDEFDTECKRIEFKVNLNYADENECNVIDYGDLKKYVMP